MSAAPGIHQSQSPHPLLESLEGQDGQVLAQSLNLNHAELSKKINFVMLMPGGELTVNLHVQCLQTKHNKVDFFYNSEWSSLCH